MSLIADCADILVFPYADGPSFNLFQRFHLGFSSRYFCQTWVLSIYLILQCQQLRFSNLDRTRLSRFVESLGLALLGRISRLLLGVD